MYKGFVLLYSASKLLNLSSMSWIIPSNSLARFSLLLCILSLDFILASKLSNDVCNPSFLLSNCSASYFIEKYTESSLPPFSDLYKSISKYKRSISSPTPAISSSNNSFSFCISLFLSVACSETAEASFLPFLSCS